jgi:hydroxymethylpyrimidine pyrophosphatase-like HAD family hydrolase
VTYRALATDYDGTIATHGGVDQVALDGIARLREKGVRILMVTGREIEDLKTVFTQFDLFDLIVGENGALLYWPKDGREVLLAKPPPPEFAQRLRTMNLDRLSVGRVIVATYEPHEIELLETIKEMGLELQVIFNKGSVMVLPTGVNKATGLKAACQELGIACEEVVGVGDAENDHAFLDLCGCSVAVGNALPALKHKVNLVTQGRHGAGVAEMIELWLQNGLQQLPAALGTAG